MYVDVRIKSSHRHNKILWLVLPLQSIKIESLKIVVVVVLEFSLTVCLIFIIKLNLLLVTALNALWRKYKRTNEITKSYTEILLTKKSINEARRAYEDWIANNTDKYSRSRLALKVLAPYLQKDDGTLYTDDYDSSLRAIKTDRICSTFENITLTHNIA